MKSLSLILSIITCSALMNIILFVFCKEFILLWQHSHWSIFFTMCSFDINLAKFKNSKFLMYSARRKIHASPDTCICCYVNIQQNFEFAKILLIKLSIITITGVSFYPGAEILTHKIVKKPKFNIPGFS